MKSGCGLWPFYATMNPGDRCLVLVVESNGCLDVTAHKITANEMGCGLKTAAGAVWVDLDAMTASPAPRVQAMFVYGGHASQFCLCTFPAVSDRVHHISALAIRLEPRATVAPSVLAELGGDPVQPVRGRFGPPGSWRVSNVV